MIKCTLCGGDYKSIEMHLTTCLKKHSITREQYDALGDELTADLAESVPEEIVDRGITQKHEILRIVEEYRARYPQHSLKQMQDALLSCGSLPPRLMRRRLFSDS